MADNQARRTSISSESKADGKTGYKVDPGPYEAEIISHIPGTRMGAMMVYIPDFGGEKTDPTNQIPVSYCSPFYGKTYNTDSQLTNPNSPQAQYLVGQSYGMWMVPPDVGNKVLVIFAAGDIGRGYWIGCIYDGPSHHMVPGISRNIGGASNTLPPTPADSITPSLGSTSVLPVVEGYSGDSQTFNPDGLTSNPRYLHEYQTSCLINQGLDRDKIRGAISSSSMREVPSNVYGISTPGRPLTPPASRVPGENAAQAFIARSGGHTFVMDDGADGTGQDPIGTDQLVRLRTSSGHQLLMNDTEQILYISSSTGNQWMEFSADGSINVFGAAGINMRSEGPLNLYSDSAVIIDSGGAVQIRGEMGVSIESMVSVGIKALVSASLTTDGLLNLGGVAGATLSAGGAVNVSAIGACKISGATVLLNSPYLPIPPTPVVPTIPALHPDVMWGGTNWTYTPGAVGSICTLVPAHEPWIDPSTGQRPKAQQSNGTLALIVGAVASFGSGAVTPGSTIASAATNVGTSVATSTAISIGANQLKKST